MISNIPLYGSEQPTLLQPSSGVQLIPLASKKLVSYDWLWTGWLARGKIHILAGTSRPVLQHVALDLAAKLSNGNTHNIYWPDTTPAISGRILILCKNSDIRDTINPALSAAHANMSAIYGISSENSSDRKNLFDLKRKYSQLDAAIKKHGPIDLIIIDPFEQALSSGSSRNFNGTQSALLRFTELAEKYNCAILALTADVDDKFYKNPLKCMPSSLANSSLVQSVMLVAEVQDVEINQHYSSFVLIRERSDSDSSSLGLTFRLHSATPESSQCGLIPTKVVDWSGSALAGSMTEILRTAEVGTRGRIKGKQQKAEQFLLSFLAKGPHYKSEVLEIASQEGILCSAIERATQSLGQRIEKTRESGVVHGRWIWVLKEPLLHQFKGNGLENYPSSRPVENLNTSDSIQRLSTQALHVQQARQPNDEADESVQPKVLFDQSRQPVRLVTLKDLDQISRFVPVAQLAEYAGLGLNNSPCEKKTDNARNKGGPSRSTAQLNTTAQHAQHAQHADMGLPNPSWDKKAGNAQGDCLSEMAKQSHALYKKYPTTPQLPFIKLASQAEQSGSTLDQYLIETVEFGNSSEHEAHDTVELFAFAYENLDKLNTQELLTQVNSAKGLRDTNLLELAAAERILRERGYQAIQEAQRSDTQTLRRSIEDAERHSDTDPLALAASKIILRKR